MSRSTQSRLVRGQAAFELALQVAHLALGDAQLLLRGRLLLGKCRRFRARLLLLVRNDHLLLAGNVEVRLQTVGAAL
jgi:hypothetical protein